MSAAYGRRFNTTRWSLVIVAGGTAPEAETALAELCEIYWHPAYAFVRRSGFDAEDARDLTQAFFARVLEKRFLKDARPELGRFRSFLLASLRHFLSNERDWRQALKRGGGYAHVPLEWEVGERMYQREPVDDLTPERLYERRWTMTVLEKAMERVADKYARSSREELFTRLKSGLMGDTGISYPDLARELSTSEGALRVAVHRLRKEFGAALRAIIAETVERPEDVDDELKYLLSVIGGSRT